MNIFKKKSLCAALAGIGALGAAGAAQAVNLNPDGLGQVLIYPYYTVRSNAAGNAFNSLLSVVNTTASAKAVKVRFLEGKNSREVLDFNLYLSHQDVWTAAIVPTAAGASVMSKDASCILPNQLPAGGQPFVTFAIDDANGTGADRLQEGYVEIIEMATYADSSTTKDNITHVNGVPKACGKQTDALGLAEALAPTGGLMGGMTLINVNSGSDYTEDAVALDNFSDTQLYTEAGRTTPDLTQASPPSSVVVANGNIYQSFWTPGPDAVSAVLMHDHIMNEFVLDAATSSGTDWVVTMPTKRFYIANGSGPNAGILFQSNFAKTIGSCDAVDLAIFDREERTTSTPLNFSPPPVTPGASLCWEANVITFNHADVNSSTVLGSLNFSNITTDFENGWLNLGFFDPANAPVHTLSTPQTVVTNIGTGNVIGTSATYQGLPVVGFAVQSFTNGTLNVNGTSVLSNYGGNFIHKGTRTISLGAPAP